MPIRCRKERCSSLYLFSLETLPGWNHASCNSIFQNARLYQAVHWLSGPCVCIFGRPLHWRITKIINVLHEDPSTCKKCKYIGEQKMEVCKSMEKFNRVELLVHWSTIALVTEQPEWHHLHDHWSLISESNESPLVMLMLKKKDLYCPSACPRLFSEEGPSESMRRWIAGIRSVAMFFRAVHTWWWPWGWWWRWWICLVIMMVVTMMIYPDNDNIAISTWQQAAKSL